MESAENHEQQSQANEPQPDQDVGLSRIETIKLLNDSIDRLEATIKGIESNEFNELPSSESIDKLVSTTQKLADTVTPPPVIEPEPIVSEIPTTVVTTEPIPSPVIDSEPIVSEIPTTVITTEPIPSPVKQTSSTTGNKPPTIKELKQQQAIANKKKLKKIVSMVLGGITVASAIAALIWFGLQPKEIDTVSLPPEAEIIVNKPTNTIPKVPEVVNSPVISNPVPEVVNPPVISNPVPEVVNPPVIINPVPEVVNPPVISNPVPEVVNPPVISNPVPEVPPVLNSPTKDSDQIVIKTPAPTSNIGDQDSEVDAPTAIAIPPDLKSPGRAKNLKIVTIEPELTFTPEQTLVASLQGKIAELISNDEANIVNFIKVDFPNNSLIVSVTDNWYELNQSRQNKFANEILQRSRKLNFSKLEVQDDQGSLVARNPVIGDQIIIVQSNKNEAT
ncbi:hypothetical protein NIES4102_02890 [Chondrocystis sp. NIES-4102]|nr:hypothetical protein NIES4102_02890 [Chondrocystis sp. NIES-4102]